jgi:DNA polymerase-1
MEKGYAETLFGRRRYIPELTSPKKPLVAFGKRVAMNAPIQGTAADIIKLAMVRVDRRLEQEGLKSRLILQVHDELILEVPEEEAEYAAKLLSEEMEGAVSLAVPLTVSTAIGENWLLAEH